MYRDLRQVMFRRSVSILSKNVSGGGPVLASNMQALGTENAFTILARAAQLQAGGKDIINLGIGQPDFPTPEHIVEAGVKALRDGHHGYTPANGIKPLREAVAADIHKY